MKKQIPLARLGKPEDVAGAVRFFASDSCRLYHGQTLNVDGGMVHFLTPSFHDSLC